VKNCLFGSHEISLREALRSGASHDELIRIIKLSVNAKHERLGGFENALAIAAKTDTARPMILIGG